MAWNDPETIRTILRETRTIAVIGLSESPGRASGMVARTMQQAGYRIVPINPSLETALREKSYASLDEACAALAADGVSIDLVDVFRASKHVSGIVVAVIRNKIPALWLQLGVVDAQAAQRAEDAGIRVVMDRCLKVEHARFGGRL
jgi:predicted CoA-binding protein